MRRAGRRRPGDEQVNRSVNPDAVGGRTGGGRRCERGRQEQKDESFEHLFPSFSNGYAVRAIG